MSEDLRTRHKRRRRAPRSSADYRYIVDGLWLGEFSNPELIRNFWNGRETLFDLWKNNGGQIREIPYSRFVIRGGRPNDSVRIAVPNKKPLQARGFPTVWLSNENNPTGGTYQVLKPFAGYSEKHPVCHGVRFDYRTLGSEQVGLSELGEQIRHHDRTATLLGPPCVIDRSLAGRSEPLRKISVPDHHPLGSHRAVQRVIPLIGDKHTLVRIVI